ncbi:arylamine N-acetyltransferase family protein [Legionella spiritensis]|uniref:arylamine N-acetyltransferase family protein n=1 Tax=Legionella spiritensis TaxID=452 RepID=UPI000F6D0651|nr:arylamine N-acetyltransferase [Legionella spiritensis]VEG90900.1 putative N-hydroxyarylamine O-acetyltransferase [Legionella spiritensis]
MTKELDNYLNKIGVDKKESEQLSGGERADYLKKIYAAHVTTFPYHNFELRDNSLQHPVIRRSLTLFDYRKLLSSQHGGYCYQSAKLLSNMLQELGFTVACCPAKVLNGLPYNAEEIKALPPTHVVLLVYLEDKRYFLDPGLGSRCPRFPIQVTGTGDVIQQQRDRFRLYPNEEGSYILEKWQKDNWITLVQSQLQPIDDKKLQSNLLKLERYPLPIPIRDHKVVASLLTDSGSKSLYWDANTETFVLAVEQDGRFNKTTLADFTKARNKLASEFNITHIGVDALKRFCYPKPLPLPAEPWTVELPLDQNEMTRLSRFL